MTTRGARRSAAAGADPATHIDAIRLLPDAAGKLAAMLAEQSPLFAGRGTNEAERLRAHIIASFETTGLPPEAVPFVLEELETGRNPYTVAAAARALRGAAEVPVAAPTLLVRAIARLAGSDDIVSFDDFQSSPANGNATTALTELAHALAHFGPRAKPALAELKALIREGSAFSPAVLAELAKAAEEVARPDVPARTCCSAEDGAEPVGPRSAGSLPPATPELADLTLEDQDGTQLSLAEAFSSRPTALAFFYTRCSNPAKCSLTVTRLARLARLLETEPLDANVAGITYDPGFDRPPRLKRYGLDRGMTFSPRCRLLRTIGRFDPLREAFDLGVGFGPVTVNRHRLDLVVLDAALNVAAKFERRLWHEKTVLNALHDATNAV